MSTLATNAITDASGGNTTTINGYTPTMSNMAGRNRIINGDMRIDQRNAGASYSQSTSTIYGLDRWSGDIDTGTGRWDVQQVSDAPVGFSNSLKVTITTQESQPTSARHQIFQSIEGYNISDLGFGTANASPITVSFWVKTSVTGIHSLNVSSGNYVYTTSYTVNSADTWEYKTITIPGATAGSWGNTNGVGLFLEFTIGGGTAEVVTANTWRADTTTKIVSGSVYLPATSGATWQITGVQLEAGSVATPFEHRQYGTELQLCQRYYTIFRCGTAYGRLLSVAVGNSSGLIRATVQLPVRMRAAASSVDYGGALYWYNGTASGAVSSVSIDVANDTVIGLNCSTTGASGNQYYMINDYAGNTAYIGINAEL